MEFAACGSLMAFMKARRAPLTERGIRHALRSATRGLLAVHSAGVVHRDIKSDNLLWCEDSRILLADLGEAGWCDDDGKTTGTKGTPYFMSVCWGDTMVAAPKLFSSHFLSVSFLSSSTARVCARAVEEERNETDKK